MKGAIELGRGVLCEEDEGGIVISIIVSLLSFPVAFILSFI